MTWKDHLYGNKEHKGLIPKLSQRAGIIHKLSYIMPRDKLNTIAKGIFFSTVWIYMGMSGVYLAMMIKSGTARLSGRRIMQSYKFGSTKFSAQSPV